MVFGLLPACGGGLAVSTPTGTTGGVAPTATGEVYRWRWQSNSNAGTATYWTAEELASNIAKASGGRLIVDLQPQGAIVGAMETFDAVGTGAIEMGNGPDCYWQGKDQRFNLIGMIAAHFSFEQAVSYYFADSTNGGQDAEALYKKFGIKRIQGTISEREVAVMSNKKKVVNAFDYKGLTFRGDGYGPLVLQEPEFAASGVMLATGDVYTALQTGVIDACEVGNAFGNYALGLQEITKYWSFPGMQQLCQLSSYMVNLDVWNKLPADLQLIFELACRGNMVRSWAFNHVESAKLLPELRSKWGIEIVRLSPECMQTWKTVGWRVADNYSLKNADFGKMWKSMKDFMSMLEPYEDLQTVVYPAKK
jgi:TRAP-type mannitol/chloroaromatic compound transport system substrate-binding protein